MGFGGIRPRGDTLLVDPRLPPQWSRLEIPVTFRRRRLRVSVRHDSMSLRASAEIQVQLPGVGAVGVGRRAVDLRRADDGWRL